MKIFLLDLWHDLREKRLWPVAVVLALGLVAVPVLLAKPAEDPGPPPAVSVDTGDQKREDLAALAQVQLGKEEGNSGSTLGVFDPSNPFKPPRGLARKEGQQSTVTGETANPGSSGGGTAEPDKSSGGGGSDAPTSDGGGGTTGGVPPTDGDGGTSETVYRYVVDLTFSANGRTRRIKSMEKLDMLPNDASPLLIFMGVTAKGSNAVFLVDSSLEAAGEGRCKPSADECAFAYVGAGSEYVFTGENGDTYTIRIDEIRKVRVGGAPKSARTAKARASVGPNRRFIPPMFVDEVVVTGDELEDSTSNSESR